MKPTQLEVKTRIFWQLSSAYEGRLDKEYTFLQMNKTINDTLKRTNPVARIAFKLRALQNDIIVQAPRLTATESPAASVSSIPT